jgi:hypothetical protein
VQTTSLETPWALAVDEKTGNVIVAGSVTPNSPFDVAFGGSEQVIVASVNGTSGAVHWVNIFGTAGEDRPLFVSPGTGSASELVYVAGYVASSAFNFFKFNFLTSPAPVISGNGNNGFGGQSDAFLAAFAASNGTLLALRRFGTAGNDKALWLSAQALSVAGSTTECFNVPCRDVQWQGAVSAFLQRNQQPFP